MTRKPTDFDGAGPNVAPRVSRSESLNLTGNKATETSQTDSEQQPPDIPRDHIIDPKAKFAEIRSVLGTAGKGEEELTPEEMYNLDLLFVSQQFNQDQTRRPPRVCANALCEIADPDSLKFLARDLDAYPKAKVGEAWIPQPFIVVSLDIEKTQPTDVAADVLKKHLITLSASLTSATPLSAQIQKMTTLLNEHDTIVAIGPLILDQHYAEDTTPQQDRLQALAELAVQFNIPLLVGQNGAEEGLASTIKHFPTETILIYTGTVTDATHELIDKLKNHGAFWLLHTDFTQPHTTAYQQAILAYPQENILLASGFATHPLYPETGWNRIYYAPKVFAAYAEALGIKNKPARNQLLHKLNNNFIRAYFGQ